MLLCLKALGGKAPISVEVDANHLWDNKRMPEMLQIIRDCDELKRRDYFTEAACAELAKPMAEHLLERAADGGWDLRPLTVSVPPGWSTPAVPDQSAVDVCEPARRADAVAAHPARSALASVRSEGKRGARRSGGRRALPARWHGVGRSGAIASSPPAKKRPDGGPAFCYRAENRGKAPSGWCRLTLALPKPLDLTRHRRLGLWIRTEGPGGILNVQLAGTDARRDHYISLKNRGWTFWFSIRPRTDRFFDYSWPYPFTDLMYTCSNVYGSVKHVHLYYNALPAGAKVACWIGRIEALEERPLPLIVADCWRPMASARCSPFR